MDDVTLVDQAPNTMLVGGVSVPAAGAMESDSVVAPRRRLGRLRGARIRVRVRTWNSLHYRNFLLLWLSTLGLAGGFWVQQLVVGWLTYDLTHSALLTSLALGLQNAPSVVVGPLGGVIADRWDRRKSLMGFLIYQTAVTGVFATIVLLGWVATWHIFLFAFAMGLAWALSEPFKTALIPNLVPRENLVNAFALNGLAFNVMRFVMPATAGILIALAGPGLALTLGVVTYAAAGLAIKLIKTEPVDRAGAPTRGSRGTIMEGFAFIKGESRVLGILVLSAIPLFLLVPFVSGLMPIYASEVFDVGPSGLGIMMSAIGVGGMIGTIVVASIGNIRNKGAAMIGTLIFSLIAAMLFSRTETLYMALPLLVLVFGGLPSFFVISSATIQSLTPDHLRGRVTSIGAMISGLIPLGGLMAGGLTERFGAQSATLMAGALFAIAMALLFLKLRRSWSFS